MLPKRNSFKVCAELRDRDIWTPIIMLTAKDGDLDEAEALDAGADDYLTKPFSFPVLVARVRSMLRRAGGARHDTRHRRRSADRHGRQTCLGGDREITLTARQFDVLEFLVRRAGQVVTKQEILDGVWNYEFAGDLNIVEVYIRRLRSAIDDPFGRHSIETVRGAGYRLAADGG